MSRGLDILMGLDVNDDWIRYSKNEARRKTDYEKHLEKTVLCLQQEIHHFENMGWFRRLFYKKRVIK